MAYPTSLCDYCIWYEVSESGSESEISDNGFGSEVSDSRSRSEVAHNTCGSEVSDSVVVNYPNPNNSTSFNEAEIFHQIFPQRSRNISNKRNKTRLKLNVENLVLGKS